LVGNNEEQFLKMGWRGGKVRGEWEEGAEKWAFSAECVRF